MRRRGPRSLRFLRLGLCLTLCAAAAGACHKTVRQDGPGPDPDTNSGPDAKVAGAKPISINRAETDSVSWPRLTRTKWKRLELKNPADPSRLDCEVRIDNTGADINLDIFNSLGTQVGFSPGPAPNKFKKLEVPIEEPGTFFVRLQAAQPKDESDFSIICKWQEIPPEKVKPTVTPVEHVHRPTGPAPPPPPPPPPPPTPDEPLEEKLSKGTEGRIVQAYRDGGSMMLNLDKGSAAGIRVGTRGQVLEGRSGLSPLEGASFEVTKVIDDTHSVARSKAREIGRNNRVVFFIK